MDYKDDDIININQQEAGNDDITEHEDYVSDKSKAISKILSDVADNFREE